MSTAQAVLSRIEKGWITKVHATVQPDAGSYLLTIQCEASHPQSGSYMQQAGQGRYPDFSTALDIMDTGIFTLTTTGNFVMDMYDVASQKTTTAEPSSAGPYDK